MIQRPGAWAAVIKRYYFRHFKVTMESARPRRDMDAATLTNCSDWSRRRTDGSGAQLRRVKRQVAAAAPRYGAADA
jgi:hypothetical protein